MWNVEHFTNSAAEKKLKNAKSTGKQGKAAAKNEKSCV